MSAFGHSISVRGARLMPTAEKTANLDVESFDHATGRMQKAKEKIPTRFSSHTTI